MYISQGKGDDLPIASPHGYATISTDLIQAACFRLAKNGRLNTIYWPLEHNCVTDLRFLMCNLQKEKIHVELALAVLDRTMNFNTFYQNTV